MQMVRKLQTEECHATDPDNSKSRLKVHLRHLANMGPSENATSPSLTSFDGVKTGQESAKFERPTDLDALSRKWGINTGCESGVVALSGGGEVAVVGGRSGSFSLRAGYEGRRGAMRDYAIWKQRSAKDNVEEGVSLQVRDTAERKLVRDPTHHDKYKRMRRNELEKVIEDEKGRLDRQSLLRWTMARTSDTRETRGVAVAKMRKSKRRPEYRKEENRENKKRKDCSTFARMRSG